MTLQSIIIRSVLVLTCTPVTKQYARAIQSPTSQDLSPPFPFARESAEATFPFTREGSQFEYCSQSRSCVSVCGFSCISECCREDACYQDDKDTWQFPVKYGKKCYERCSRDCAWEWEEHVSEPVQCALECQQGCGYDAATASISGTEGSTVKRKERKTKQKGKRDGQGGQGVEGDAAMEASLCISECVSECTLERGCASCASGCVATCQDECQLSPTDVVALSALQVEKPDSYVYDESFLANSAMVCYQGCYVGCYMGADCESEDQERESVYQFDPEAGRVFKWGPEQGKCHHYCIATCSQGLTQPRLAGTGSSMDSACYDNCMPNCVTIVNTHATGNGASQENATDYDDESDYYSHDEL